MLEHIEIQNFLCLRDVKVPLRPLTVLIGENDTGKSAFLLAVELLFGRPEQPLDELYHWRREVKYAISIAAVFRGVKVSLTRSPDGGTKYKQSRNLISVITETSRPRNTLVLQKTALPMGGPTLRSGWDAGDSGFPRLGALGDNLPSFMEYLLRRDREKFDTIVATMRRLVPGFSDLLVGIPSAKERDLDFRTSGGLTIPGDRVSAGVRILLYFVALAHHPTPPSILLLEEPENGVHPRRLAEIMKLLRALTTGELGASKTQVILSTHSPYLLDHVNIDEDQVLVFRRQDDGSRTAEPVNRERLKHFLDEFKLGEVWFNEGEDKLVQEPG